MHVLYLAQALLSVKDATICVLVLSNMSTNYVAKKLMASAQASNATTEMSSHLDVDDLDASVSRSVAENNDPDSLVV